MDRNASFGYWVRRQRKALDLTQAELAHQVGCAEGTLRMIEADTRRPSRQLAARLADQLAIPFSDRPTFIRVARAELLADRLPDPVMGLQHRTNVAAQPTPLIGRAREVEDVCTLFRASAVRLVTLTGPGGVGKTRLGLQVAVELRGDFAAGSCVVNLAPLHDPDQVASVIAQTLDIRQTTSRPLLSTLTEYLHDRQVLLVLDNFEHLLGAAVVVAEILAACPHVKILTTSRERLHLRGEQEVTISPFPVPDLTLVPGLAALTQCAAVALFIARAQDVHRGFALSSENALAVAQICARLDGLPLAIELAATRIKVMSVNGLVGQLSHRLGVLTGGARDLPLRQQTLRATIDWSYTLLTAGEQRLFRWCSVFAGGASLEGIAAVSSTSPEVPGPRPIAVLDGVTALVDKSLLRQETGTGGTPRFVMLETIREYALELLVACGEDALIRQRHAHYYWGLAERAAPRLQGAEQFACMAELAAEYDNLRAVLAWSQAAADRAEGGLGLAADLWLFWELSGHISEGRAQLTRMLAHANAAAPTQAHVRALFTAGMLAGAQGDVALAQTHLTASLRHSVTLGYQLGMAYAYYGQGFVAWLRDTYLTARAYYTQSLRLFRELDQRWAIARTLHAYGDIELYLGAPDAAVPLLEQSLALFRTLGDQHMYSRVVLSRGYAARLQGDNRGATARYTESLAVFQTQRNPWGIAAIHLALGDHAQAQGDAARAAACFAEGLVHYREIGHREGVSLCLAGVAWAAASCDNPVRAALLYGAAAGLRAAIGAGESGPPSERQLYDASMARIRAQMTAATFTAAWEEGRRMTMDQAISLALE